MGYRFFDPGKRLFDNMRIYPLLFIAALSLSFTSARAQLVFTGKVTNAAGKPMEFATAALYDTDSALFKGSVTDATGTFRFDRVDPGRYTLEVRLIGYQTVRRPVDLRASETNLGVITLTETGVGLSEVTITAAAPPVMQRSDRLIVRPELYMLTSGKNAADVLRQLPGVITDPSGTISVVGKAAVVYINGKPADLTGTTVEQLLKTLQAERIERVELITNPPARYEAAHSGAIIDIRLRRDESMGLNGTASASYYLKTTGPAVEPNLSANYRVGRWNVYGSYGGNMGRYEHEGYNVNRYHTLDIPLEYTAHNVFRPSGTIHNGSLGVDWYASDGHTFGFLARGGRYDGGNTNRTTTDIRRIGRAEVDSSLHSPLTMDIYNNNLSLDLNHVWIPSKQTRLSTDVIYAYADHNQEQQMISHYVSSDGRTLRPHEGSGHSVFQKTNVWLVKTDLEVPLPADARLETGAQFSAIRRNNNLKGLTLTGADDWINDASRSNHFIYKEQIGGLYVNLSRAWGERFSGSVGLRAEHTLRDGYQEVSDTSFRHICWELFPSASAQVSLGGGQSLSLSYARKVDRPSFSSLNPFRFYESPTSYQEGNPDLQPSYRNNLQLVYRLHRYSLSLSYTHTDGMIIQEPSQDDATRMQRYYYMNFGKVDLATISLNLPFTLAPRWTMNVNANGFYRAYHSRFMGSDFRQASFYGHAYVSNRFDWGRSWQMQLSGYVVTPMWILARHYQTRGSMELGIEKSLWNGRGSLSATLNDPFHWETSRYTLRYGNIDSEGWAQSDTRYLRIDFSYRFGSDKIKRSRQRRTGAETFNSRL